jgi:DNA invertase Pin-like site-specific DNA recombinase
MKTFVLKETDGFLRAFIDEEKAGLLDKRDGLRNLLNDAKARAFDAVAVHSFRRLARSGICSSRLTEPFK